MGLQKVQARQLRRQAQAHPPRWKSWSLHGEAAEEGKEAKMWSYYQAVLPMWSCNEGSLPDQPLQKVQARQLWRQAQAHPPRWKSWSLHGDPAEEGKGFLRRQRRQRSVVSSSLH